MPDLSGVSTDDLRAALELVSERTPSLRLMAAIAYKNGVTQTELSEWFGVERKTIYNWLDRIEGSDDLVDAVTDAPRPGRPRKLATAELEQLTDDLAMSPAEYEFEESAWTPPILQTHIENQFGVEYSVPSCRRILDELS